MTLADAQQRLTQARVAREEAFETYASARATVRQLEDASARSRRERSDDDVDARLSRARKQAQSAKDELERAALAERDAFDGFVAFSDPRKQIGELSDDLPILLFPLRLETRFKTVEDGGARHELWVRIFADTCLIDTFEPELSAPELHSARAYWQEVWRAGGEDDGRRAAWRNLVASHGSGRAEWLVDNYRPLNEGEEPVKGPGDVVLVIGTDSAPSDADAAALATYWAASWRAGGAADAQQAARAALDTDVGQQHADQLLAQYAPFNFGDRPLPPKNRGNTNVSLAFVVFSAQPAGASSWTRAPRVDLLPERFVLLAVSAAGTLEEVGAPVASPLYVGPDPSAPPDQSIRIENGELVVPDELAWLVDFDKAVAQGMGFRVELSEDQAAAGFDHLVVLGLRLGADAETAQHDLEQLLAHHRSSRSGLALVPQGTPTNNTESQSSGLSSGDDADESYADLAKGDLFTPTADWLTKSDGQRLAEALGIDFKALTRVRHAGGADHRDALAMNVALWPATLGYFLETMMSPVFADAAVDEVRTFFTRFVTGRGALPAFRVGSQPYGVLPTTAFSRIAWANGGTFVERLYQMLRHLQADWTAYASAVSHVTAKPEGDGQRSLLDILGLHPSSVEFHSRYAQSVDELYNHLKLSGGNGALQTLIEDPGYAGDARLLLQALGYQGQPPDLLSLVFQRRQAVLDGGVIDDRPLSESVGIRAWTDDNRNYLEWLADTARTSLDDVRLQRGFTDERPPTLLLYLLARHAVMLGYHDAGYGLYRSSGVVSDEQLRALKTEPKFIHITDDAADSESRWAPLYEPEPQISGDRPLWEHITEVLPNADETEHLREQTDALDLLKGASTARLERAFAEHLDCCEYRLDAWLLALVGLQLEQMRARRSRMSHGLRLGAYGWLEDVRPKSAQPQPVTLPPDLARDFDGPLLRDPSNGGFVHAPSLDHATTAAILRSGFLANASPANPATLSVNLSSRRVRLALNLLDGIRSGQSLGALLGYRLERGLHDGHGAIEVDTYIYALRKAFPLRADRIADTATPPDVPIDVVEARNVVDGLRLVEHVRTTGSSAYPFGLGTLPSAGSTERAAIDAEVDALVDVYDAVADLALAEGVHQAARGNFDRVAATLDSYTKGHFPPEPDVVRTPTVGTELTHRVGLHLDPDATAPANATPRARAEPALNDWLADVLPPLDEMFCVVEWKEPPYGADQQATVTLDQLGLQPIDLLYLLRTDDEHALSELDDRIVWQTIGAEQTRPDAALSVRYLVRKSGSVSLFEAAPLVRALRSIVLSCRPLRATDVAMPTEVSRADDDQVSVNRDFVNDVASDLDTLQGDLAGFVANVQPLLDDQPNRRDDVVAAIDTWIGQAVPLLADAAAYGMGQAGFGFAIEGRRKTYAAVIGRVQERIDRFEAKLIEFQNALDEYDALPANTPDTELFSRLQGAELKIRSATSPLPAQPATLRQTIEHERPDFEDKRDALDGIVSGSLSGLSDLFDAVDTTVAAAMPLSDLDAQPFTIDDLRQQTVALAGALAAAVQSAADEADRRVEAATDHIADCDAAAAGPAKFDALDAAAKALLGEDFRLLSRFKVSTARGAEWQNGLAASLGGDLLRYLDEELEVLDPVDEWLAGVAPVREKMAAWQQAALHADLFRTSELELTPIQLPYGANDRWLALRFPPDYELDGSRLLYTAHYAKAFAPGDDQCGLLIDEWTEVIPGVSHNTGIAFHFDRPSSEPPQSLLLVTPASWGTGAWQWDDLVQGVVETFDLARIRAVEPRQIDTTAYATFLPAVIMAATLRGLTIGTILAANDRVLEAIERRG